MEVKLFMVDVTYDNVVVQLNDKCYNDTLNNFYADYKKCGFGSIRNMQHNFLNKFYTDAIDNFYSDYKKCDFSSIRNMQHNFLSGEIIIDDEHVDNDPFEEIGLDALNKIDVLLDKQNKRRNPPPATVEEVQELKLAELAQVTALFENNLNKDMYFTSSLGFRVNGDRRTRSNIEDLIHFSPDFPVEYRDYDNQKREVTQEQLQTMLVEHITNGENLYYQKWLLESQIQECTTIEEVNAIEIKFEMMDFSNTESEETE